jgi:hypothetical protein
MRVEFVLEVAASKEGHELDTVELFTKSIELFGGLPRPGDLVNLSADGWSEEVARVWWNMDETPVSYSVEFRRVTDGLQEGLADTLRERGWKQS